MIKNTKEKCFECQNYYLDINIISIYWARALDSLDSMYLDSCGRDLWSSLPLILPPYL